MKIHNVIKICLLSFLLILSVPAGAVGVRFAIHENLQSLNKARLVTPRQQVEVAQVRSPAQARASDEKLKDVIKMELRRTSSSRRKATLTKN